MKFKIDENLPEELVALLRESGWDCTSVVEEELGGEDDSRIAEICDAEQRILITFDRGFSDITTHPPAEHPGYVVFRLRSQDKPYVLKVSARLVAALRNRELQSELWIVEEDRIRIRTG